MLLNTLTEGAVIATSGALLFGATILADKAIKQLRLDRNTVELPPKSLGETIAEGAGEVATWATVGNDEVVAAAEGVGAHVGHAVEAVVNALAHH